MHDADIDIDSVSSEDDTTPVDDSVQPVDLSDGFAPACPTVGVTPLSGTGPSNAYQTPPTPASLYAKTRCLLYPDKETEPPDMGARQICELKVAARALLEAPALGRNPLPFIATFSQASTSPPPAHPVGPDASTSDADALMPLARSTSGRVTELSLVLAQAATMSVGVEAPVVLENFAASMHAGSGENLTCRTVDCLNRCFPRAQYVNDYSMVAHA